MIMKKITSILLVICLTFSSLLCCFATTDNGEVAAAVAVDEKTFYAKQGAAGSGSSADDATSFWNALVLAAAEAEDAKIQVVGEVLIDLTNYWAFPYNTNKITITGYGTQGKLNFYTPVVNNAFWCLNGDIQMEYIEVNVSPSTVYIMPQCNSLYMMDGITMTSGSKGMTLRNTNGYDTSHKYDSATKSYKADYDIVVRSGYYEQINPVAMGGTKGHIDGNCRVYVGGEARVTSMIMARDVWGASIKNLTVILDGGMIEGLIAYQNWSKATDLSTYGSFGAMENYKVIVTENFNIEQSFNNELWGQPENVTYGISGFSLWKVHASYLTYNKAWDYLAYTGIDGTTLGQYTVEIEEGVYDKTLPYIFADQFTAGGITSIASGTGLPADLLPEIFVPGDDVDPDDGGETPDDGDDIPDIEAQPNTVYVKHNGDGDGLTPKTPTGNFITAMNLAAEMEGDATVQVIGEIFWIFGKTAFYSPAHTNKIRITGEGTNGKITADTTNGGSSIWYLGGDTQLDNIELSINPSVMYIITRLHSFYALEGVKMSDNSKKIELLGVLNEANHAYDEASNTFVADYEIVLLSGAYNWVAPFCENASVADLVGEVTFTIGGTADVYLLVASIGSNSCADKVNVYLDGGVIHTALGFSNKGGVAISTNNVSYAKDEFNVYVTENFDISKSFTDHAWGDSVTYGISGTSIWNDAASAFDSDLVGDYNLFIAEEKYDEVIAYVNEDSFSFVGFIGDEPTKPVYGDINGDGAFNNTDITELVRYLSGWTVSEAVIDNADFDENGTANNRDAMALIVALVSADE